MEAGGQLIAARRFAVAGEDERIWSQPAVTALGVACAITDVSLRARGGTETLGFTHQLR